MTSTRSLVKTQRLALPPTRRGSWPWGTNCYWILLALFSDRMVACWKLGSWLYTLSQRQRQLLQSLHGLLSHDKSKSMHNGFSKGLQQWDGSQSWRMMCLFARFGEECHRWCSPLHWQFASLLALVSQRLKLMGKHCFQCSPVRCCSEKSSLFHCRHPDTSHQSCQQ